jgi:hypothetical protein
MMTIPRDASKCPLCGKVVALHHDIVSTCHFVAEPSDPLFQCAGVPFHRRCFLTWDRRAEFARRYNEAMSDHVFADGAHYQLREDGVMARVET